MALAKQSASIGGALVNLLVGAANDGSLAAAHVAVDASGNPVGTASNPLMVQQPNSSTQAVSIESLPLPTGAAQDGIDAGGVTAPAGGSGIRGWLSGIYAKLSGTLAVAVQGTVPVSGFPASQAITAAALPLPAGASTEATVASLATKLDALTAIERPYQGVVAMTVDQAQIAQRAIRINCTAAGNVSLTYTDNSTDVIPVAVGLSYVAGAFIRVNSSGTTATATYANMK